MTRKVARKKRSPSADSSSAVQRLHRCLVLHVELMTEEHAQQPRRSDPRTPR